VPEEVKKVKQFREAAFSKTLKNFVSIRYFERRAPFTRGLIVGTLRQEIQLLRNH
jgi:hypothetical protein